MVSVGFRGGKTEDSPRLIGTRFMKLVGIEMAGGADGSGDRVRERT